MRYVYNSSERILRDLLYYNKADGKPTHRPVCLNRKEGKLLMILSDRKFHTYEDISEFVWETEIVTCENIGEKYKIIDRKTAINRISSTCYTMLKKLKSFELQYECIKNVGIKLISKEKIWIE